MTPPAFVALGLYGVLRWGTMLRPQPIWRLLGLLAIAVAVAALQRVPLARRRLLAVLVAVIAVSAIIPISGLPLGWVLHLRVAVTLRAIGDGLSGLPRVLVPYGGLDNSLRSVIVIGAGVLLLDSALILACAPAVLGEGRLMVAALPLIVLAIVPAALARPSAPYLQGLLLFGLLVVFIWGERARLAGRFSVVGLLLVAAVLATVLAPGIDPRSPWINFERLAGKLGPGRGELFDWHQDYGPLSWPRAERQVFTVQAPRPEYWKTEDLDSFDGHGWTVSPSPGAGPVGGVASAALRRWSEQLHVSVTGMSSDQVIAAGTAAEPVGLARSPVAGAGYGTFLASPTLGPGSSYTVAVYAPNPAPAELRAAGSDYPLLTRSTELSISLPGFQAVSRSGSATIPPLDVTFSPFHSGPAVRPVSNVNAAQAYRILQYSPYGRAFALARRLAARARTPYGFVRSVLVYLSHGFTYNESPIATRLPIEDFLFRTRLGYCQQFAGAMALLLRMGGVPARVATGFTSGTYTPAARGWVVADQDAHSWVEAWFPRYGWVKFDPTPGTAPARAAQSQASGAGLGSSASLPTLPPKPRPAPRRSIDSNPGAGGGPGHPAGGASMLVIGLVVIGVPVLGGGLVTLSWWRRDEDPLTELERAFARNGDPLEAGTTLAGLEARLRSSTEAAGYVRALRMQRYAAASEKPSAGQRRALRTQLGAAGGPLRRLRAVWALPPLRPRGTVRKDARRPS